MNQIEIETLDVPELHIYKESSEVQLLRYDEPKPGLFIAESAKVINRALAAGYVPVSVLAERRQAESDPEIGALLRRCGEIPVYTAQQNLLKELTGYQLMRGVLAAFRRKELPQAKDLCRMARRIAVLEHVTNPTNAGAIFRSAAALGVDAILLSPDCTDPLYRRAARVSMGTVFQVPWTFFEKGSWPEDGMALLRAQGFCSLALALREDIVLIDDPHLLQAPRLALFLGAEGDGLMPETIRACDYTVRIPMAHGVDSLNVAAASAVAFFALCRDSTSNDPVKR